MKAIKLFSDNWDGQLFTPAAYKEVTLQMSTGDFHSHTKETVEVGENDEVMDVADLYGGALPENLRDLYGGTCEVIKQLRVSDVLGFVLYRTASQEYGFTSRGRGTVRMKVRYHVEVWCGMMNPAQNGTSSWLNKAAGLKAFKAAQSHYKLDDDSAIGVIKHEKYK